MVEASPWVEDNLSDNLRELRNRNAFAKVSGVPKANPQTPFDQAVYKPALDFIWDVFGEDFIA